jgi:hypothetical protein
MEGAAQWGERQHETQPTRASCNGRPLALALVDRPVVVLSKKKPVSLIPVQQRMSSHVDWESYRCLHCTDDTERETSAMWIVVVDLKM